MKKIISQNRGHFLALCFVIILLGIRMLFHQNFRLGFLLWNMLLAVLPLIISSKIQQVRKGYYQFLVCSIWLLLFPNAAYLVTDLTHLPNGASRGYWLDLMILFCVALLGIAIATKSLRQMEVWYSTILPKRTSHLLTVSLLLLNGYGIYLGRVERWNSWDALTDTQALTYAIGYQIRHPFRCQEVWLQSLVFSASLALVYFSLKIAGPASSTILVPEKRKSQND